MVRRWLAAPLVIAITILNVGDATAAGPQDPSKSLHFRWDLGADADVVEKSVPRITDPARVGKAGADGDTTYRELMPKVYQMVMVMPAFDFDAANHGAINHPFYMTIRFKDVASAGVFVHAGKGGSGFYGAGWVGQFGGEADGKWKEETIIIPRSMMRCQDGKTFRFALSNVTAAVPVDWIELFSADAKLADIKDRVAAGHKQVDQRRQATRSRLLAKFKDLGLPDPGKDTPYTKIEKDRKFRVFFPPINRQMFPNSVPADGELIDDQNSLSLSACAGESETIVVAVRAIEDIGQVKVRMGWMKSDPPPGIEIPPARWALWTEQRIGSSWGTDYRMCAEQLVQKESQEVKPDRLQLATFTIKVPPGTKPGTYSGQVLITTEKGGQASIPLALVVYPFELLQVPHGTHGQFYYASGTDPNPFELQDMAEHGMTMMTSGLGPHWLPADGKLDMAPVRKTLTMMKKMGYLSPLICDTGVLGRYAAADTPENRRKYLDYVSQTRKVFEEIGFKDTGFFPVDEPHADPKLKDPAQTPKIKEAKLACEWIKAAGGKSYVTSNPVAVPILDEVLDYVCYNIAYLSPETVGGVRKSGDTLMFYCPSIDVNPEYNRYRPGYFMYKLGAYSSQYFAYMELIGDPWVDLDGANRDWNVVYPSMTSVYHDPTLEWEAMREGVDDYRYMHTLKTLAEAARKAGRADAADKALKVLQAVLEPVHTDGKKAGGPAIEIEANVALKDRQLTGDELKAAQAQMTAAWYDQSRRKIASAIIELQKETDAVPRE